MADQTLVITGQTGGGTPATLAAKLYSYSDLATSLGTLTFTETAAGTGIYKCLRSGVTNSGAHVLIGTLDSTAWHILLENATASYWGIHSAITALASAILDAVAASHDDAGSIGEAINNAGAAADPLTSVVPGSYGVGTAGRIIGDNLNATVGSRSSHSAADVWAVGTRSLTTFGTLVADVATAVWNSLTSGMTTVGSIGKKLDDWVIGTTQTADVATVESRLTAARAGYLDNLNVSGPVASQADINALNQSASRRVLLVTVPQYERPESGTNSYTIEARLFDGDGASVNADSTPPLTATGIVSGSLAANLSAATNPATGVYRWTYSETSAAALEQIRIDLSAVISGSTVTLSAYTQSADFIAATWTTTDSSNLTAVFNKLPSRAFIAGTTSATGAPLEADLPLLTTINNNVLAVPGVITTDHGPGSYERNTEPTTPPTAEQIDTQLSLTHGNTAWGGVIDGASIRTALGMAAADLDDQLDAILIATGAGAGAGARLVTITVDDGIDPLEAATVRMTQGAESYSQPTNASGIATFSLDDATWAVTITKALYTFAPTTIIVNGDETATYSMTATVITPPTNPLLSAIEVLCLDSTGQIEAGVDVDIRIITIPSGSQNIAFRGAKQSATSNSLGIARFEVVQGSTCEWKRGLAEVWQQVAIDNDSVTNVVSVIGSP